MLRIDRDSQTLSALSNPSLSDVSITERYDLQEFIANSPTHFFNEVGEQLYLLGKEVTPSPEVQDRIDLLCIDPKGTLVVVELKRGNHKLQMMQAISYAGMLTDWTVDDVMDRLNDEEQEELQDFLDVELENVNRGQRIVLFAEGYDYSLLSAAAWLNEEYGVPVSCCRVHVATDEVSQAEYLACSTVYPPPELAQQAVARGRGRNTERDREGKWTTWEEAFASTSNQAVQDFFREQIASGQDSQLKYRVIRYRVHGKRRFYVEIRSKKAYAVQIGRFPGDDKFWAEALSKPESLGTRNDGRELKFDLYTPDDFSEFRRAAIESLVDADWSNEAPAIEEDEANDTDRSPLRHGLV